MEPLTYRICGVTPILRFASGLSRGATTARRTPVREIGLKLFTSSLTVGLRIGEALGLKWSDIDLYTGTLCVNRQLQWYTGKGFVFSEPIAR